MTPEQFTYWLQGYAEIDGTPPSQAQWDMVMDHLKTVFDKQTPDYTITTPGNPGEWAQPTITSPNTVIC